MDNCVDLLGSAAIFLTLNASSGCWKIELDEKDMDETTFVTQNRFKLYTRIHSEPEITPAIFRRAMHVILETVNWKYALLYMDDVMNIPSTSGEHI